MVNHFQLGKPTGIEQGYEAAGYIPNPDNGYAPAANLRQHGLWPSHDGHAAADGRGAVQRA